MRSSVERRKSQPCVACYIKSSINLLRFCWRYRVGLPNLHAMFVGEINYKHFADSRTGSSAAYKRTLVAGKKSWTSKIYNKANSAINVIIKVSSWRLYNVGNQQGEVLKPKILKIAKDYRSLRLQQSGRWKSVAWVVGVWGQTADNKRTGGVYINEKFAINLHYSYKKNLAIQWLCIFYKPRN